MEHKLNKRILSALLAIVMLFTMVPTVVLANESEQSSGFAVYYAGEKIGNLDLPENEKLTVSAENIPADAAYCWQVQVPGTDIWVDIQGETDKELALSYALLKNMLDGRNCAAVRCNAVVNGEVADNTDALQVQLVASAIINLQ